MNLSETVNSGTFWTAIGAIAAVIAAIFPILQAIERRKMKGLRLSKKRISELAEEGVFKFDYWMKNYNHFGEKNHKRKTLEWLRADKGLEIIGTDYNVFKKMAILLRQKGYDTIPAPSEREFLDVVKKIK